MSRRGSPTRNRRRERGSVRAPVIPARLVAVADPSLEARERAAREDLRDGLITMGKAYMHRRLSPAPIANVRIVSTQPEGSTIGKEFYERILGPAWRRLANRFKMMMDSGILVPADPWIAAMQWKGMCEWDMFERRLLGAIKEADPDEIERASTAAKAPASEVNRKRRRFMSGR